MAAPTHTAERAESRTRPLAIADVGLIGYQECWALQNSLAADVASGRALETLLLLEHPHTYTCGRSGGRDHILVSEADLAREGVTILDVDRGGDVTYHGPGQLVAYPIIDLRSRSEAIDYHAYLRALEQTLIDTLADFAIRSQRLSGYSGVWVGGTGRESKIAAIGVRVDARGITTHGIALNVTTDLSYFRKIVPCGIADKDVTSMVEQLGVPPAMPQVKSVFAHHFATRFEFSMLDEYNYLHGK